MAKCVVVSGERCACVCFIMPVTLSRLPCALRSLLCRGITALGMVCMRLETSKEATLPNWHFCLVRHCDLLAAVSKVVSETKEGTYKDYDLERFKNGYFLETPEGIKTPFADTALSLEGAIRISLYLL